MKKPEKDDYVIVKITKVIPYGAFCELVEFPGYTGFIHISETSTAWVKNIRSHVKEGQMRVAKVLSVSHDKKTADLSLKRVSGAVEKRKLEEIRRKKRGKGLLSVAGKKIGRDPSEVEEILEKEFGDVLNAFEEVLFEGEDVLKDVKIPEEWKKAIVEVAKKYIELPKKEIKVEMKIVVPGPKGAKAIREVLMEGAEKVKENAEVRVYTVGAPRYVAEITTTDYKKSEKLVKEFCKVVEEKVKKAGGEFEVVS